MTTPDPKCVELPVRASQSKLWEIQRNYFRSMGIEAWDGVVPYYISSNRFIAQRYANLAICAIQDWVKRDPRCQSEMFYFLELGCGTGKFSFNFLKAFEALLKVHKLDWVKYCYILSDVADKNIAFCQTNPDFASYIAQKKVDFTHFDIVNDKDFTLIHSQKHFSSLGVLTPLTVIANYTFDCVELDLFEHRENQYHEVKLGIKSRYNHFDIAKSKHLDDLRLEYTSDLVNIENYYADLILQDILKNYQIKFKGADFFLAVPLGAIEFIRTLALLTNNKYLIISGDKGVSQLQNIPLIEKKHLASYDGCYSFYVNFQALGEYVQQLGGDSLLTTSALGFKVNLYSGSIPFSDLVNTAAFYDIFLEKMGPSEYCSFYSEYISNAYRYNFPALISFVKMSEYDPEAYTLIHERLLEILPSLDRAAILQLESVLQRVQENIYGIKMGDNIYNLVGVIYYLIKQYDKAQPLFERSIMLFPKDASPYHNLGLLHQAREQIPEAIENFKKAYELDKTDELAKHRYQILSGKPSTRWVKPFLKTLLVLGLIGAALYFTKK